MTTPYKLVLHDSFFNHTIRRLKPRTAHCLPLAASVFDAVRLFATSHVGSVFVLDDNDVLRGIFTERDLITKFDANRPIEEIKLPEVMSSPVEHMRSSASLGRLLHTISRLGVRYVAIIDRAKDTRRIISARDVIDFVFNLVMQKDAAASHGEVASAAEIKAFFDSPVSTLNPRAPVILPEDENIYQTIQVLKQQRAGSLMISNSTSQCAGIFGERDLSLRVFAKGLEIKRTKLKEVMTPQPVCIKDSAPISEAFTLMSPRGFRHIPLLNDSGQPCGLISIHDLISVLGQHT